MSPAARFEPLITGVYGDRRRGIFHLDVPRLLTSRGIPDSPTTRRRFGCRALRQLRGELPSVVIIARLQGVRAG